MDTSGPRPGALVFADDQGVATLPGTISEEWDIEPGEDWDTIDPGTYSWSVTPHGQAEVLASTGLEIAELCPALPTDVEVGDDAVLSDDGGWIAIGSAGVAHSYGWLYDIAAQEHHFAAFQYGGSVAAHSWSPDDRFALFSIGSPADVDLLKVVDRTDLEPYPHDTGFVVEVDEEQAHEPPYAYEFMDWQAPHLLCFDFEGTPYCVDAGTRQVSVG